MKESILVVTLIVVICFSRFSQSNEETKQITGKHSDKNLKQLEQKCAIDFDQNYSLAIESAQQNSWDPIVYPTPTNGRFSMESSNQLLTKYQISECSGDGKLLYSTLLWNLKSQTVDLLWREGVCFCTYC